MRQEPQLLWRSNPFHVAHAACNIKRNRRTVCAETPLRSHELCGMETRPQIHGAETTVIPITRSRSPTSYKLGDEGFGKGMVHAERCPIAAGGRVQIAAQGQISALWG